jgi:hypothetical protein
MNLRATSLAVGLAVLLGCESAYDKAGPAASAPPAPPVAAEPVASQPAGADVSEPAPEATPPAPEPEQPPGRAAGRAADLVGLAPPESSPPVEQPSAPAEQPSAPAESPLASAESPPATREVASKDTVGKRVQAGEGYLGGVLRAPARIENRLTLLNMQKALDFYKATNGYYPRSHDDFMREIVQANQIQLPTLQPGERYVYDPQDAKLYVERQN